MENGELIELQVSGMHCNNCALSVHKLLEKKGMRSAVIEAVTAAAKKNHQLGKKKEK